MSPYFEQPIAHKGLIDTRGLPGVNLGPLILIPEASRGTGWQLFAGTAAAFTDAWGVGVANIYTPKGVKGLLLFYAITWTGDGVADYTQFIMRKNGSAVTSGLQGTNVSYDFKNLANGTETSDYGQVSMECDSDGIIEYMRPAGYAGSLYLITHGYYMGG